MSNNLSGDTNQKEPERNVIERALADVFPWGSHHYSNACDALGAAKRGGKR